MIDARPGEPAPAPRPAPARARLRVWRALLLGLLLLPLDAYWAADIASDIIMSLLEPPLCSLMVLALLNVPLRRWLPRLALTGGELAVTYIFLSVGTAMCAEWLWINFAYIPHFALFADRNPWEKAHMVPNLPGWFFPQDGAALEDYRRGGHYSVLYALGRLGVWWRPIAAWTALFGLLCGAMLCINTLMREQWTRREKLAFPIIQVPVLLTRPESPAWRSPVLWGAFAVMFAVDMLNGFAFLYPQVPSVNVRFLAGRLGDSFPWLYNPPYSAIGWTQVGIFPYMSAIGLFMPTDLLFSLVFFFFVRKGMQVGLEMYGFEQGVFGGSWLVPAPPYLSEQTWGAIAALFLGTLAASRGYLRETWGHIRAGTAFVPDELRPRTALAGLLLCLVGLASIGVACGLSAWLVLGYVAVFLAFSVVLTRMRAQVGPPIHEFAFLGPHQLLLDFGGSRALGEAATVRIYSLFFITNRIHRTDPMPYQLEGYKLAEGTGLRARTVFWVILAATVLGLVAGHLAYAYHGYRYGGQPAGGETSNAVRTIVEQQHPRNPPAIAAMLAGFCVAAGLDAIRFRAPGFPLHPVGYALSLNYGIDYCWFGLLIVLVLKGWVQRYAGLKGYEKLRLAAIGIILAEFGAELIWSGYSMSTHVTTYSVSFYNRTGWLQ